MARATTSTFTRFALRQGIEALSSVVGTNRAIADELSRVGVLLEDADTGSAAVDALLEAAEALAASAPDPDEFALKFAWQQLRSEEQRLLVLAARSAPSLGDALQRFTTLVHQLDAKTTTRLVVDRDGAELTFGKRAGELQMSKVIGNSALSVTRTIIQSAAIRGMGGVVYRFPYPEPRRVRAWRQCFGPLLEFGAPAYGVRVPARALEAPMRTADRVLSDLLMPEIGDAPDPRAELAAEVRAVLGEILSSKTQLLTGVAARLGMSPRTLQRRLHGLDLNFAELTDQARRQRALALIADPELSVKEVARGVGFEDIRAFRAAFQRWTGATPRQFRHGRRPPR